MTMPYTDPVVQPGQHRDALTPPSAMPDTTLAPPSVRIRELEAHEFGILSTLPGPLQHATIAPGMARVLVVERDGEIAGYWMVYDAPHAEPLWLREDVRGRYDVVKPLLEAMVALLQECGVTFTFAIIGDQDLAMNVPLAERIGFTKIPGQLYGAVVPKVT